MSKNFRELDQLRGWSRQSLCQATLPSEDSLNPISVILCLAKSDSAVDGTA